MAHPAPCAGHQRVVESHDDDRDVVDANDDRDVVNAKT